LTTTTIIPSPTLLDEVDKIKPRSELFMLLNLLEGNEIHKVVKKVEYHIKLKLRVFATDLPLLLLPLIFWPTYQPYDSEVLVAVAASLQHNDYKLITSMLNEIHEKIRFNNFS
jgi:hypothetical protein